MTLAARHSLYLCSCPTILLACAQVQASAWSRWRFGDKAAKGPEEQLHARGGAEIYIMLPLSIIAVGELSEGEEVSFIHQCAHRWQCPFSPPVFWTLCAASVP